MQSFELNLNTAMHELHQRSERVQLLEGELAMIKKDMDNKNSMISGLTRERSSIKATSPIMDMSVMTTMNEQLLQREGQMRELEEKHAAREQELASELDHLREALHHAEAAKSSIPGFFPETPATSSESNKQLGDSYSSVGDAESLRREVAQWQSKHQAAVSSMQDSEQRLLSTISELESSMAAVETMKNEAEERAQRSESTASAGNTDTMKALRRELDDHKATSAIHVDKIARLAQLQESARSQAEEAASFREASERELDTHRKNIASLEEQVHHHEAQVSFHKHGLKTLQDTDTQKTRQIEQLTSDVQDREAAIADMQRQHQNLKDVHTGHITRLESEVIDLKSQLDRSRSGLADELEQSRATCNHLERQRDDIQRQAESLRADNQAASRTNKARTAEMAELRAEKGAVRESG